MKLTPSLVSFALLTLASTSGCDRTTRTVEVDLPSTIDFSDGFQQSDADAIVQKCDAVGVDLTVQSSGEITFEVDPNTDYEASSCVLNYIKESGTTKAGFVGNEKYATPEEGQ